MIFRLGELFCGPGGLAWGAMNADIGNPDFGIVHAWANDYDENTCQTYRRNICPNAPETVYHADVRKFDLKNLAPIDAFAFGFPCNDYSVVGEQKGMEGVYGPLYSYGITVLKRYKPQWFLAENVSKFKTTVRRLLKYWQKCERQGISFTPTYISLKLTGFHKHGTGLSL